MFPSIFPIVDISPEKKNGIQTRDYKCGDGRSGSSAHDCQAPIPTSQNLEVEQRIRFFIIIKLRIAKSPG
jgi:hypothetical protein